MLKRLQHRTPNTIYYRAVNTPYTNPMINNPPCSISNHECREERAHGFSTASVLEPSPRRLPTPHPRALLTLLTQATAARRLAPPLSGRRLARRERRSARGPASVVGSTASPALRPPMEAWGGRNKREEGGRRRDLGLGVEEGRGGRSGVARRPGDQNVELRNLLSILAIVKKNSG
jgi:hypothetical protein